MNTDDITREVRITRSASGPDGVVGDLEDQDTGFRCKTIERPDLNNQHDMSCIPSGRYPAVWEYSPHHGCDLYHLHDVPDRDVIEMHAANVMEDLKGCCGLGQDMELVAQGSIRAGVPSRPMIGVTHSKATLVAFHKNMQDDDGQQLPFWLTIE